MNTQQQKGFTIIEVVLVLAIAALIFLMIFVALPALQRGQRDSARKNEVGAIASAVNTFRSNGRGNLPTASTVTNPEASNHPMQGYLDELSEITSVRVSDTEADGNATLTEGQAVIVTDAKCSDDGRSVIDGSPRQAAVVAYVESGGMYCQTA